MLGKHNVEGILGASPLSHTLQGTGRPVPWFCLVVVTPSSGLCQWLGLTAPTSALFSGASRSLLLAKLFMPTSRAGKI